MYLPRHAKIHSPRLVIFDFDGTLFRTQESISHCISLTFSALSQPAPTPEATRSSIATGAALDETFRMLGAGRASAIVSQGPAGSENSSGGADADADFDTSLWIDTYRSIYAEEGLPLIAPFPHARSLMAFLKKAGISTVVISNKGVKAVEAVLNKERMAGLVDLVLGDMPGVPRKPDPTSYLQFVAPKFATAANRLNPDDVMVVGDTAADIQFAKNIGAVSCWARYGYGDAERCEGLGPDLVIESLEELERIVSIIV